MIVFNLSQALTKVLSSHLKPVKNILPSLHWDLELITIGLDQCVIACERNTQYIMLFCAMSREQFLHFPELFQDRFWREVMALSPQISQRDKNAFIRYLLTASDDQYYQLNPNPLEEGKLHTIIENLEYRTIAEKVALPADGKAALQYTLPINGRKRKNSDSSPLENFRDICLSMAEEVRIHEQHLKDIASPITGREENIVKVDFNKPRNKR